MSGEKTSLVMGLCDDESHIHDKVQEMVQNYEEENGISIQVIHYTSAQQLLEREDVLDFLLLDIDMPQMDGIEAGFQLRDRNVSYKIIMLTARADRFRDAFKIGAFRFVSKPIDKAELYEAINAVREHMVGQQKVTVYQNGVHYEILQRDILYIRTEDSSTMVYTQKHEFKSEESLQGWLQMLDERAFFQCHRSYIVNMEKIKQMEGNNLRLLDEEKIPVSRRVKKAFLNAYMIYDTQWR